MSDDNRRRALADVLTTDAWHEAFSAKRGKANLHVDVVFGTARVSGGEASAIRFRLTLKRAEIVVILPDMEPVTISTPSVRRDAPKPVKGKIQDTRKVTTKVGGGLDASVGASISGPKASGRMNALLSRLTARDQSASLSQDFSGMTVVQSKTAEGQYRWIVTPVPGMTLLDGRPWDAAKQPLLELADQRVDRSKGIAPTTRVEVRCLREDLEITNIVLADETMGARLKRRKHAQTRRIAAEAAIRTMLAQEGLIAGDLADPYAQLTLAMITAEPV